MRFAEAACVERRRPKKWCDLKLADVINECAQCRLTIYNYQRPIPSQFVCLTSLHTIIVHCSRAFRLVPLGSAVLLAGTASYHMKRLPANRQHSSESRQQTSCMSTECGEHLNEAS